MSYLQKAKEWEAKRLGQRTDKADTDQAKQEPIDTRIEAAKARTLLKEQGWCAVRSQALGGEIIVWAKDGKVVIPTRWQGNARYTLDELVALAAEPRVTPDGLRRIHEAKKLFSGTVTREGETP